MRPAPSRSHPACLCQPTSTSNRGGEGQRRPNRGALAAWARCSQSCRDEARRIQAKQEAQWDRERLAREKLMNQVLAERAQQLEEKKVLVRRKQTESIKAREALLEQLDDLQQVSHQPELAMGAMSHEGTYGLPWG